MSLYMPPSSGNYELPPEGSHTAVCYRVIDLGTQDTAFQGEQKRKHQILIQWELSEERMSDGRPFTISRKYTYSSHKRAGLRKDLESWRGAPFKDEEIQNFDIGTLLGCACMMGVAHEENDRGKFPVITALMRMPKGAPRRMSVVNEALCFSLADRPFNVEGFGQLSERVQEIIKRSPEYVAAVLGRDPNEEPPSATSEADYGLNDDIPF